MIRTPLNFSITSNRIPAPLTSMRIACALLCVVLANGCSVRNDESGGGAGDNSSNPNSPQVGMGEINPATGRRAPLSCDAGDMKSWVYDNMKDYYLFYDQVDPTVDTTSYNDVESLITDLRVAPYDTFSYIAEEVEYNAFFNDGETFGFGWRFAENADNEFYFSLVEPNSPLALANVQRGDQLIAINGIFMPDFLELPTAQRSEILGTGDQLTTLDLTIGKPLGSPVNVTVTKAVYSLETVLDTRVIDRNGVRIGYLHFYQFIDTSRAELANAFASLAAENVSEIVLDLRYNGGGRISVANELASYLLGSGNTDQAFTTFAYNDKYQQYNESLNFVNMSNALDINRVFVLQSDNTCSASELVVNGLRPFMEVITVGSTSCGKPYATSPNAACGKVMNALEIELVNATGVGGYFNGIGADCPASENVSQTLGSSGENLLSAALGYIESGRCSTIASRTLTQKKLPPELAPPAWQGLSSM